jgi:hypothetical protein
VALERIHLLLQWRQKGNNIPDAEEQNALTVEEEHLALKNSTILDDDGGGAHGGCRQCWNIFVHSCIPCCSPCEIN